MTLSAVRRKLTDCLAALERGHLDRRDLQAALDLLEPAPRRTQDILYLQCSGSALTSTVLGMSQVENGEVQAEPEDPADYPYATVLEAVRAGWRIVQFPNLALLMDEKRTYGLGCEFILER